MKFNYEKRYENNEKWYTVGVVKDLVPNEDIYAVEIMDPAGRSLCEKSEWKPGSVAVALFGITPEEYEMFSEETEKFDELVEKLKENIPTDRLLAERSCVRKSDRKETIDEASEFKTYLSAKIQKAAPERVKVDVNAITELILNADKIFVAYSAVTDRPALNVVNDKVNLVMSTDEPLMDSFISNKKNIYKKTFLREAIESKDSVFAYFHKLGVNVTGLLVPNGQVINLPLEAILTSELYKGKKADELFCNNGLDCYITCFLQLLRSSEVNDQNREELDKNARFLDVKIMETALDAEFLMYQKAVKKENGQIEFALSVVEQRETGEKLIPVATMDEELAPAPEGFEKVAVKYDKLVEVVNGSKLDGFVINCRSKSSYKFNKQKIEQTAKFKAWKEEQESKSEANSENK